MKGQKVPNTEKGGLEGPRNLGKHQLKEVAAPEINSASIAERYGASVPKNFKAKKIVPKNLRD